MTERAAWLLIAELKRTGWLPPLCRTVQTLWHVGAIDRPVYAAMMTRLFAHPNYRPDEPIWPVDDDASRIEFCEHAAATCG